MGSNNVKLLLAEVHVVVGVAAVSVLLATGHLDSAAGTGLLGGLLGVGVGAPLVAYSPPGAAQEAVAANTAAVVAAAHPAPVVASPAATGAPAETPGQITGTGTSAMPTGT